MGVSSIFVSCHLHMLFSRAFPFSRHSHGIFLFSQSFPPQPAVPWSCLSGIWLLHVWKLLAVVLLMNVADYTGWFFRTV